MIDNFVVVLGLSFNQPKFCSNASWNLNAVTFVGTVGTQPIALFINTNNVIFTASYSSGDIFIWRNSTVTPTKTISASLSNPRSLFVTSDEQIFADNANTNRRVDRWSSNGTKLDSPMSVCSSPCSGMFVDVLDNLYCSQLVNHQVTRRSLLLPSSTITIVAGTGCNGSTDDTLTFPQGIFVTVQLDLYVADCGNNRVQLYRSGQLNATTVITNGSNGTAIVLSCPSGVVLDGDGYLFIVDQGHDRIIGSDRWGFRCVVACSGQGTGANQLKVPQRMSFDRDGNLFVTDTNNNRIQKFFLLNTSCGKSRDFLDPFFTMKKMNLNFF